jgi:hypothetical protein
MISERLASALQPTILFGNCRILDDNGQLWGINKPCNCDLISWLLPEGESLIPVNPVQYFYTSDLHNLVGYFDETEEYVMDIDFLFRAVGSANCLYVDRLFGNFRLISGTKTLGDIKDGKSEERLIELRKNYIRKLPLRTRIRYELRSILNSTSLKR